MVLLVPVALVSFGRREPLLTVHGWHKFQAESHRGGSAGRKASRERCIVAFGKLTCLPSSQNSYRHGLRTPLESRKTSRLAREEIFAETPLFMGIASIKFKNGDMEAMGKNLGGAVCLFLVPKIVEVLVAWAGQ